MNPSFKQSFICFKKKNECFLSVLVSNICLLDNVVTCTRTAVYHAMITTFTSFYVWAKEMHGLVNISKWWKCADDVQIVALIFSLFCDILFRCTATAQLNCLSSFKMYILISVKVPRPRQVFFAFCLDALLENVWENKEEKRKIVVICVTIASFIFSMPNELPASQWE